MHLEGVAATAGYRNEACMPRSGSGKDEEPVFLGLAAASFSAPGSVHAGVILDVQINDSGGASDCLTIGIRRRAIYPCGPWIGIQCIPRQSGVRTLQLIDGSVDLNTSYVYEAVGYGFVPAACVFQSDPSAFNRAFDPTGWGFPIIVFTTVGPDPTPIAHGRLVVSHDATPAFQIESCADGCPTYFGSGYGTPELNPYIGTDTEVFLYGTIAYCCNCCGHLMNVTSVVPHSCLPPIAVDMKAWADVKQLYK